MSDYELNNLERRKFFKNRSHKRPIGYCEDCGKPIYNTDSDGEPYRLCYSCNNRV